jgi:hypothetical protein
MLVHFESPDELPIIAELSDGEAMKLAPHAGMVLDVSWPRDATLTYRAEA